MGLIMQDHPPAHYVAMHWAQDLTSVAEDYNGEGFVHDNLRGAEYIREPERILLIDFGWDGDEEVVSFLTRLDTSTKA